MFRIIQKKSFIFLLIFIEMFAFLQHSHAQLYSTSFDEYVKEKGISDLDNTKDTIICGKKDNKCNRKTQICLKCASQGTLGWLYNGKKEEGKCFSYSGDKNKLNSETIRRIAGDWCEDADSTNTTLGEVGAFFGTKGSRTLSYQPNGFLAHNEVGYAFITITTNPNNAAFKDKDGNTYNLIFDGNEPSLVYAANQVRGCEVLPIKIYKMKKCFFCPLAAVVFDTANQVTALSFNSFAESFKILIIVGFALWLAYTSLQLVFTYTKQDTAKNITAILQQAGKFLIAFVLLSYPDDLFRLFITPILEAAIDMADGVKAFNITTENYTASPLSSTTYFNSGDLYHKIEKFLAGVQNQLSAMQAIGSSLFCISGRVMLSFFTIDNPIATGLKMMFLGIILFIFSLLLSISFAFYFIDALLQLTIFGAMLPIMIAGWPWPVGQLKSYATTGLKLILNVFFVIFLTSLVVAVEIGLIKSALDEIAKDKTIQTSNGSGLDGIFNAIDTQNIDDLITLTDINGKGFLLLIFASIFGFKFVKEINAIAQKLSGGANLNIAPKIATMGASAAKGVVDKVTSPVRKHASESFHAKGGIGGVIGRTLQAPAKFANKLGLGNSKIAKKVQSSTHNFAQNAHSMAQGLANKKGIKGFFGKIAANHLNKAANAAENIGKKGLLGAIGEKLENFSIKVGNAYIAAERERRERESWLNAHPDKDRADYDKQKEKNSRSTGGGRGRSGNNRGSGGG